MSKELDVVYIVTKGWWSDYGIEAVFSSAVDAEAFVLEHQDELEKDDWDAMRVETWPLRTMAESWMFRIVMKRDGDVSEIERFDPQTKPWQSKIGWDIRWNGSEMWRWCRAKSREQAIKNTNELRGVLIATGQWRDDVNSKNWHEPEAQPEQ